MAKSVYGFAGRSAFERNYRAMRTAERMVHTPWARGSIVGFVPNATPVHAYVEVQKPLVKREPRNLYPAALTIRNTDAESPTDAWQDLGEDEDTTPVPCMAFTPHGEVLRKEVRYESRVVGLFVVTQPDDPRDSSFLSITPPDVAQIQLPADHGIKVEDRLQVTWNGGERYDVLVDAVIGDVIQVSGGTGNSYPAVETPIKVSKLVTEELPAAIVDCSDSVEIIRVLDERNADGDYKGYVQEYDEATDDWRDGEEVWVRNAN